MVAVVLAAAASLTALAPGPAHAASVTGLPITSVYQVVAASAQGHIFISQGPDAGADAPIVVTNLSGTEVAAIGDGARGLALSANDETLYAAIGDTVTAYSTTTLKQTASYPTPGLAWQVALQSGLLWVSYQNASSSMGLVGGINLADPAAPLASVPGEWVDFPPAIAVDTTDAGTGILVTSGVPLAGGTPTATYNVSDPSAVTLIGSSTSLICGSSGLTVLRGGKTFLCDGVPYSTTTLVTTIYPDTYYAGYAAEAPDGALAIAASGGSLVAAYPTGVATPTASYDQWYGLPLPASFNAATSNALGFAWSATSEQLFTVMQSTNNVGDSVYTLLSLYPFERVPTDLTDLTLTSTATTVQYGAPATVTAHLGVTYSNRSMSVYDSVAGGARRLLWGGEATGPSGNVSFAYPSFTRDETFTAAFSGDNYYSPATVTLAIKVGVKIAASTSGYYKTAVVSGLDYHVYHRNATLKSLITVTPAKPGECVRYQVQQGSHSVWDAGTTTGCVALNKWSQTMLTRKLGSTGWFRVRADFTPSAKDLANVSTDGAWVYYVVTS